MFKFMVQNYIPAQYIIKNSPIPERISYKWLLYVNDIMLQDY